ncbi:bifunctional ADP-dependent NAD(P)H-hydrate dehydratase/NAD(P)H-hydrate epimerase, partial [Rhodobacteraceae bacterium WD3A24]
TALVDARLTALALGPGLGLARARALVPDALAARRATVLDADALMAFEAAPERLFEKLHAGCVLTPHAGEFARLFPDLTEGAGSRLDAVRAAARRAGAVVLLKGPATIIAAPDGRAAIHDALHARVAPWLATAGAGDVLAGIITALLARGHASMDAAAHAVWLHVEAARAAGPGLIAEDLPEALPAVLRGLAAADRPE